MKVHARGTAADGVIVIALGILLGALTCAQGLSSLITQEQTGLAIARDENKLVRLSWVGGGVIEKTTNLTNRDWVEQRALISGVVLEPSQPHEFYRLRISDEEFVGPFPSWRDLKRDYGAVGDGKADDSPALQRAFNDLIHHQDFNVLYVPAGEYRLTRTVKTVRSQHHDCLGVTLVGEDPARTILRWDGEDGGTMVQWDAWYSKISRLTFDGMGRASIGLFYGPAFSTYNETSDIVFRDLSVGIQFGGPETSGQAENAVLRCQFLRCNGAGIVTVNWNSMDIWVWYCLFQDCQKGIHNVMGSYHAWENLFLRTKNYDLSLDNLGIFSAVGNTSIGSGGFFLFPAGHTWGSPTTIQANRIINPVGKTAVTLADAGPFLVLDNVFYFSPAPPRQAIQMTWGDQVLVGNLYTRSNSVTTAGRFLQFAEQVVPPSMVNTNLPVLPGTPQRRNRPVFEVPRNGTDVQIQSAIDEATRFSDQRPVVHLPAGAFRVARTIVVPAGTDIQIVGDGAAETASRLEWVGPSGGVVLLLKGPARATLRDFFINAGSAQGIVVEDMDQPGGRVFADQLNARGPGVGNNVCAVRLDGVDYTDVLFRCLQGSGDGGNWVDVIGGPLSALNRATNEIAVVHGATGTANGQYNVRNGGRLVVRGVYHECDSPRVEGLRLSGNGVLAVDTTRFSYTTSATKPLVRVADFSGLLTLATCTFLPVGTTNTCRIEITGDGAGGSVMALANQFWVEEPGVDADKVWNNGSTPPLAGGLVLCNMNGGNENIPGGQGPLANRGSYDASLIIKQLDPIRKTRTWLPGAAPAGVTDLRFHRVMVSGNHGATVEFRARH